METDTQTNSAQWPAWQRERALALQRICRELKNRLAAGAALKVALREICSLHAGALVGPSGAERGLRLSTGSLYRHYRNWLKTGETIEAFALDYRPGREKVHPDLLREFHRLATMDGMRRLSVAMDVLRKRWAAGQEIPGLGTWTEWWAKEKPDLPVPGTAPEFPVSERTLYRYQPKRALRALGNNGIAAFRRESVSIERTSAALRPCELFVLDDKRVDLLVLDDETGQVADVCIYLMQEVGSRRIVGFTARPANAMNSTDTDALIARVLEKEGIGHGYPTHILLERGTVAMSPAAQQLLEAVTGGRVKIHRTGMDGGVKAPGFARDRMTGHWQGKGTIEAFCGKLDLMLMHLPGQRGNKRENMPANLAWSMKRKVSGPNGQDVERVVSGGEAAMAQALAQVEKRCEHKIRFDTGLLWLSQFGLLLQEIIQAHNASRDHDYEGFGLVTQCERMPGVWEDAPSCN